MSPPVFGDISSNVLLKSFKSRLLAGDISLLKSRAKPAKGLFV